MTSVSVCSAEVQAAQVLATMLLHCQDPNLVSSASFTGIETLSHFHLQLGYVLSVFREVSTRYSQLADTAVQDALAACRDGAEPHWLCDNLWRIAVAMENAEQGIR